MTQTKATRRLSIGAAQIQPALRTLADLRRAITGEADIADVLLLVDELTSDLLRCEDACGVQTPAILFD